MSMDPARAADRLAAFAQRCGSYNEAAGAWECMVDAGKSTADKSSPWLPYVRAAAWWPGAGLDAAELLERVDGIYDKAHFSFRNNFIATFGGTDNAVALWRWMVAPMARIELRVEGVQVRYMPAARAGSEAIPQPAPGQLAPAAAGGVSGNGGAGGRVELAVLSAQAWHLPQLLLLVRAVLGPAVRVRVTSTLAVDLPSGKIVSRDDHLDNWLSLPLLLRLLLGAFVPLAMSILHPI